MKNKEVKNLIIINIIVFLFFVISCLVIKNMVIKYCLFIISLVFIFIINFIYIKKLSNNIDSLSNYIDKILNEDFVNINEYNLDKIPNLKKDVLSLVDKIKEKNELLEKEKRYLYELLEDISYQIKTPYKEVNTKLENNTDYKKEFLCRNKNQIEKIEMFISNLLKSG